MGRLRIETAIANGSAIQSLTMKPAKATV